MLGLNFFGGAKWSTTHGDFGGVDDGAWETSLFGVWGGVEY